MKQHEAERKTSTHAYFWNSIYSQWYTTTNQFVENNIKYNNAESYMMYKKALLFNDTEIAQEILKSNHPGTVKRLGRKIKNFDDQKWNDNKLDIVERANYLKFTQNPDLLRMLLADKDLILVEASPQDKIWGIGLHFDDDKVLDENNWNGENLLGKCIMNIRNDILNKESE